MTDIFDAKILCRNCNIVMQPQIVERNGLELRAVKCERCGDIIVHPADLNGMEQFKDLRGKTFNVKLRMVGNSHAISIPKEIISFINERHRDMRRNMDDMVRLCFEDFDTLRLRFWEDGDEEDESDGYNKEGESLNLEDDGDESISEIRIKKIRRGEGK